MKDNQSKDTGLAMVLICLLVASWGNRPGFVLPAILLLILSMTWPAAFYYPSRVWFGFAHLMGGVMSRVVLTVLFFGLVTPLGILRRIGGADPMRTKQWKNGETSVFKTRDHMYRSEDIEQPY